MPVDIDEIQGENAEEIVAHKARAAFEIAQKPVVVTDDSWAILALGGFPGAYMKSINHWFQPEDFLRLMHGIENRDVILHQYVAYHDGLETTVFGHDIPGKMLHEARGKNDTPATKLITLEGDNGRTIAEVDEAGQEYAFSQASTSAWHAFAKWYKERSA